MPEKRNGVQELKPKIRPRMEPKANVKQHAASEEKPAISWREQVKRKPGEELLKNLAVASALVVCALALRSGAVPSLTQPTDAVLAAVSGDTLLDEQLGKLSFVSALFPEATLVFGEQTADALIMPVSGAAVAHAWSEAEPYISWSCASGQVVSSLNGEVSGVYHGNDEERIVQVTADSGLSCLYGNLASAAVAAGDAVQAGDVLGTLLPGAECVMEVRRNGYSVDPAALLEALP
ncbi:MAG: peptidoglycan DD-metalloendopeptidase family protein [Aristaeellaceae bacterium]